MYPNDIYKRYLSGKPRKVTTPIAFPSAIQPVLYTIGESKNFLRNVLKSGFLKHNSIRAVVSARTLSIKGKPGKDVNYGSAEAYSLKSDNMVGTIHFDPLNVNETRGYAIDVSPVLSFVKERLWTLSKPQVAEALHNGVSQWKQTNTDKKHVVTVIELPSSMKLRERLMFANKQEKPLDFIFQDILNLNLADFVANPSMLFICNSACTFFTRLDTTDVLTDDKEKIIRVLLRLDKFYKGEVLSPEEEEANKGWKEDEQEVKTALPVNEPVDPAPAPVKEVKITAAERRKKELIVKLDTNQSNLKFKTTTGKQTTLKEMRANIPFASKLDETLVPGKYVDETLAKPTFDRISKNYIEKGNYDHDLMEVLSSLSIDENVPLYLEEITRVPSSDTMNLKETLSLRYRDTSGNVGKTTTIHVDLPIFTKDNYLFLNGVKWNITKQILANPIIKVKPHEVLITTAYNKAIVERFGSNLSFRTTYVRQVINSIYNTIEHGKGVKIILGSAHPANKDFVNPPEYDNIGNTVQYIETPYMGMYFARRLAETETKKHCPDSEKITIDRTKEFILGWQGVSVLIMNNDGSIKRVNPFTQQVEEDDLTFDELINRLALTIPEYNLNIPSINSRKSAYSRTKLLSQYLPTAIISGYLDGIETLLQESGAEYYIQNHDEAKTLERSKFTQIKFEDKIVSFRNTSLKHSLLLNGLRELETDDRPLADFAALGTGWLHYISEVMGSAGHAKALVNYKTSFIDPMTKGLLEQRNIKPTLTAVLIYANNLLENNSYEVPNDMVNYHFRGPELVNALLYKAIHKELEKVRNTRESALPQKLNIQQNEIIKNLLTASNVEEVADLNPLLEVEIRGKASWTGAAGGLGDSGSVTRAMRNFHPSMNGLFGFYSPDSAEVGVKRTLSLNTAVTDTRGTIGKFTGSPAGKLGFGELLSPFTATHADPPRIGMQCKQGTHTMPIVRHTPPLIGSGAERSLAYSIGNTFAYKTDKDGVLDLSEIKHNIVRIKHEDGTNSIIDMSERSIKNSGGGFYINSKLVLCKGLRAGSKVKAGNVVAFDDKFFSENDDGEISYKAGAMVRAAIVCLDRTYEDSLLITNKLVLDSVAEVTKPRTVSLGPKAKIQKIVSVGDKVGPNDPLVIFENISDDTDIATLLDRIGSDFNEVVAGLARNMSAAKYSGEIVEMRIYYNRDLEEFSPSIRKLITDHTKLANARSKVIEDSKVTNEFIRVFTPERIHRDKVNGETFDGLLIFFLLKTTDVAAPGDKFVSQSPLKGVISHVLDEGEEPFSEDGKTVDYVVSPLSLVSRMTSDAFMQLWGNAGVVGLKEVVLEIAKR